MRLITQMWEISARANPQRFFIDYDCYCHYTCSDMKVSG